MWLLGIPFFSLIALIVGKRYARDESILMTAGWGLLVTLAAIAVLGSISYYLFAFTTPIMIAILLCMGGFLIVFRKDLLEALTELRSLASGIIVTIKKNYWLTLAHLLLFSVIAGAFAILFTHRTVDAVNSPWEVVPYSFFILYGFALLFFTLPRVPSPQFRVPFLILLTFLALSVAWIVFPIGYGFDPFIHQATEKVIAVQGTITPKPFYAIGQYTIVVFLAKLLGISVVWIDKLLVPLLAALLIPASIQSWFRTQKGGSGIARRDMSSDHELGVPSNDGTSDRETRSEDRRWSEPNGRREQSAAHPLILAGYLLLPFFLSQFIMTTPQALGNLFLIVLIFHGTWNTKHITPWILALAALVTHPLAGIPAFIFLIINFLQTKGSRLLHASPVPKRSFWFRVTCYMLCAVTVPLAFLFASQFSSQINISFTPQNFLPWLSSIEWSGIYRENRFNALFDVIYFYGFNVKNIFWFFVATGILTLWKNKKNVTCYMLHVTCFLLLLTNYIILRGFLSFDFLIGYEQTDYAKRLLDISFFFLLPFFFLGLSFWIERLTARGVWWERLLIILLALAMTASLFLAYPQRVDRYAMHHGITTSQNDIDAVRWIDADANGEDYIVLANQAVSAAAMKEFGFKKYYGALYFYPIPTSSPLYQSYLDMVYPPKFSEENLGGYMTFTMRQAMERVGAQRAYFVLNSYWTDSENVLAQAKQELSLIHAINNRVFIFRN